MSTTGENKRPAKRKRGVKPYEVRLPAIKDMVRQAYASTGSFSAAGRQLGIAKDTVKQVLTRNPDDFATAQKILASKAASYADSALDRAHATLDKLSGLPAIIAAKTAGQMQLEQLGKSPAVAVQVNIAQALGDTAALLDKLRAQVATVTPAELVQSKEGEQATIETPGTLAHDDDQRAG